MTTLTNNYYTARREALLDEFDEVFKIASGPLLDTYSQEASDALVAETRQAFDALIPDIPYIGGADNALTENLVMAAWFLAFFRVMAAHGCPTAEAYEIVYELVDRWLRRYPPAFVKMMGALRLTPLYISSLKKRAERSQKREYPGDWVYSFVPGDGEQYDYATEYAECGICKFFHDQKADDLIPYMCALDYPMTRAYGLDLHRTMTLGAGAAKCDFKIKRGKKLEQADLSLQDMGVP